MMSDFSVDAVMRKKRLEAKRQRDQRQAVEVQVEPKAPEQKVIEEIPVESSERPRKTSYPKPSGRVSSKKETYIKSLPEGAVTIAKKMFPGAKSNKDALAAYIYFKSMHGYDAPDNIRELVSEYESEETTYESLSAQIQNLSHRFENLSLTVSELELAVVYLLFDRLGFRKGDVSSVDGIDFLENGVEDLFARLRTSAIMKRNRDGRKKEPRRELK